MNVNGCEVGPGADLRGADLEGADLRGARFSSNSVICLGPGHRAYEMVAIQQANGYRIKAGCRWFTYTEACEHWADNAEQMARVELAETIAKLRGLGEA